MTHLQALLPGNEDNDDEAEVVGSQQQTLEQMYRHSWRELWRAGDASADGTSTTPEAAPPEEGRSGADSNIPSEPLSIFLRTLLQDIKAQSCRLLEVQP